LIIDEEYGKQKHERGQSIGHPAKPRSPLSLGQIRGGEVNSPDRVQPVPVLETLLADKEYAWNA
jgi:hypothetical protein